MRRREFIAALGGVAAWPVMARAQLQNERTRRVGVLMLGEESDPVAQTLFAELQGGLQKLGWEEGRNLRIDIRFGARDQGRIRNYAQELVGLAPDAVVTWGGAATRAAHQETQTIPIIFVGVGDPVANGFVQSIARPEANITGITNLFYSMGGKWVQLLKEVAPHTERVGVLFFVGVNQVTGLFAGEAEDAATHLGLTVIRIPFRDDSEIKRGIDAVAAEPNGGVIFTPPAPTAAHRATILQTAAKRGLSVISDNFANEGALISYGPDYNDLWRHGAADYVNRILRGAKPGDLPVQFPTKLDLVVNFNTAKALGLAMPQSILLRADRVIE